MLPNHGTPEPTSPSVFEPSPTFAPPVTLPTGPPTALLPESTYAPPPFPPAVNPGPEPAKPRKERRWLNRAGLVLGGAAVAVLPLAVMWSGTVNQRDELEVALANTEDELADTEGELDDVTDTLATTEADLAATETDLADTQAERDNARADADTCRRSTELTNQAFANMLLASGDLLDAVGTGIYLDVINTSASLDSAGFYMEETNRLMTEAEPLINLCVG